MRWSAIGLGLGAAILLIPALFYVWSRKNAEDRGPAAAYLIPGFIILGIAAIFAVVWVMRHVA